MNLQNIIKEGEIKLKKMAELRKQSKYHRNYIAIHIVKALLSSRTTEGYRAGLAKAIELIKNDGKATLISQELKIIEEKTTDNCDCVCHTIIPLKRGEAYPRQFDRPVECEHCTRRLQDIIEKTNDPTTNLHP